MMARASVSWATSPSHRYIEVTLGIRFTQAASRSSTRVVATCPARSVVGKVQNKVTTPVAIGAL